MRQRARLCVVGVAVLMAGLLMVSGPAAGQEKHLTVYGSTQEMGVRHITEAFTKDTGIKVDWIRMSTGETLNRIRAEKSNPRASIWLCGPGTEPAPENRTGV